MTATKVLAWLLIALVPIHGWALAVVLAGIHRSPGVHALRPQLLRLGFTAGGALGIGVIAANFLLGSPLPRGAGFALLVAVLLSISGPPVVFLLDYYRPGPHQGDP